ncbi:hypothetical protein CRV24_009023 [Beauveria bassiana]|nr:hypothetical protein CRV24_009023 [Beauveria bassiana]
MRRDSFIVTYDSSKRPGSIARYHIQSAYDGADVNASRKKEIPRLDGSLYRHGPPKPPVPHVAPIYRLTATALGAGMWFWDRF